MQEHIVYMYQQGSVVIESDSSHIYQDITSDSSSIPWFVPIEICTWLRWLDWLDSTRTLKWDQMTRLVTTLQQGQIGLISGASPFVSIIHGLGHY